MSKIYFGFGIADSMFPQSCSLRKQGITPEEIQGLSEAGELTPCLNPSHSETIRVMRNKFGISVEIPEKAPVVKLAVGDRLVVMAVSGLPRLEGRHEYSPEEIQGCSFNFSIYTVEE